VIENLERTGLIAAICGSSKIAPQRRWWFAPWSRMLRLDHPPTIFGKCLGDLRGERHLLGGTGLRQLGGDAL